MTIDMEQFYDIFFEESLESLDIMEQSLLTISSSGESDNEIINTIFRAAHSIKGGSGTFGFTSVSKFTHVLETLLDEVREGERVLTEESIELLLRSCDCLRVMIYALQARNTPNLDQSTLLIEAFNQILQSDNTSSPSTSEEPQSALVGDDENNWIITFIPDKGILKTGNEPLRLFKELETLGTLSCEANASAMPDIDDLVPDECFLSWKIELTQSMASYEEILEVFDWVIDECEVDIQLADSNALEAIEPPSENVVEPVSPKPQAPAVSASKDVNNEQEVRSSSAASASSIRVGIDKVDDLFNLVGELVITQSMLSELGSNFDMSKLEKLSSGLEQLLQNTKEMQESVMRIRMLPISFAFNRFPRMIRDLSVQIDKKVELIIQGENTELDKTVMEKISDPLVHLVRNAIDHGIETSEERLAKGKPEEGNIRLNAYHQGGNIVIEVGDDGKGLNKDVIFNKAVEKGLIEKESQLTEPEIFDLVFQPGFSTAHQVSDISGRGVGMDVVKRNIKSLGGRILIESEVNVGTTIRVHLPLTLAILDGQLVRVGQEVYVVPLLSIVESLQIKSELVNRVSGDVLLYRLREDNVPIIRVYEEFGIEAENTDIDNALLVVVEGDGQKVGLLVDELLAQQQVVIKSLESNYKRVEGISGATILGDGSVSMILDIPGLISCASKRSRKCSRQRAA
jgi:two-component system chemotaxis sensor kinase CheA